MDFYTTHTLQMTTSYHQFVHKRTQLGRRRGTTDSGLLNVEQSDMLKAELFIDRNRTLPCGFLNQVTF